MQEKHIVTVGSGKFDVNGKEIPRIKEQKTVDKHFQPDTAAIIFTLPTQNRNAGATDKTRKLPGRTAKTLYRPPVH